MDWKGLRISLLSLLLLFCLSSSFNKSPFVSGDSLDSENNDNSKLQDDLNELLVDIENENQDQESAEESLSTFTEKERLYSQGKFLDCFLFSSIFLIFVLFV